MKKAWTLGLIVAVWCAVPTSAAADVGPACREANAATRVGIGLALLGAHVDPPVEVDVLRHRAVSGLGPGLTVQAVRGVAPTWSLRGAFGYARLPVTRTDLDGSNPQRIATISDSRFEVAGVKAAAGQGSRACLLWMIGGNVHRLRLDQHAATMLGLMLGIQANWRVADRSRLFIEFAVDASHNRSGDTFGVVLFFPRFVVGVERRF